MDRRYTGFKDKNGRKIYEGDTIKWLDSHHRSRITKVEWQPQTGFSPFADIEPDCDDYYTPKEIEIISSITRKEKDV